MDNSKTLTINDQSKKTKKLVLTSILFAISLVLAWLESILPPLPIAVPGIKMGLSNIAVMYALFFIGAKQAYGIAVLKSAFVVITRGLIAGVFSLTGGLLSITVMLLIMVITKRNASYSIVSIFGAITHNIGQFIVISLIYAGTNVWFYFPVLIISGVATGLLTAGILNVILPAFKKLV